jgi:hypothetical protein
VGIFCGYPLGMGKLPSLVLIFFLGGISLSNFFVVDKFTQISLINLSLVTLIKKIDFTNCIPIIYINIFFSYISPLYYIVISLVIIALLLEKE